MQVNTKLGILNDKYIAGSYDFDYDKENPRVQVNIRSYK